MEIRAEGGGMRRRARVAVIVFVVVSIFLDLTALAEDQEQPTIVVGYIPLLAQLPLVVSYENDRVNYSHTIIKLVRFRSFASLEAALRVGAIDAADLPLAEVLSIVADHIPIKIIGQYHSGGSVFESLEMKSVAESKGKIIGVPGLRSAENLEIIRILSAQNLRYGLDYKTIKVPFNTVLESLKAGKINAIFFPEPYGSIAENDGTARQMEVHEKTPVKVLTSVLAIRSELLEEKYKMALSEWLSSLARSCLFIEEDIASLSARQTAIIQEPYFGFPRELVSSSLVNRRGMIRFSYEKPDKKVIATYQQYFLDAKILTDRVDIDTLVSNANIQPNGLSSQ